MNTITRQSQKVPGWDCIRHPCGRNGCGTRPGSHHGIHCEDWVYVVGDGEVALSLTVYSGVYPASVPDPTREGFPHGADLTLHVGFPVPRGRKNDCGYVAGGTCYQGGRYSLAGGAGEFVERHFDAAAGFEQGEAFWAAMEARLAAWSPDARAERIVESPPAGDHTPTPWYVKPPGHGHATECLCVQVGEDEMYSTLELKPADARFIVRAVNTHALLVAACERALAFITDDVVERDILLAALAQAKGDVS